MKWVRVTDFIRSSFPNTSVYTDIFPICASFLFALRNLAGNLVYIQTLLELNSLVISILVTSSIIL